MLKGAKRFAIGVAAFLLHSISTAQADRQIERLGRGVVAVRNSNGKVFVSWRLLATDTRDVGFNLYRSTATREPIKLNDQPLARGTNFVDEIADVEGAHRYFVRPVHNTIEQPPSAAFSLSGNPTRYLSVPLRTPPGYSPNDASVGDLDGDGEYEIVLHQVGRGRDNSQRGMTTEPILEAYRLDGAFLWRINVGKNIREGAHYTQFMVYDLDGDGKAEIACKTADGTIDGQGNALGDAYCIALCRHAATASAA